MLLSAVELGLFTTLGSQAMTGARAAARRSALHPRANPDFFDALVALRFLERDGDGADGALSQHGGNRACSSTGTARSSWAASWRWPTRACTASGATSPKALRTGSPQNEIKHTGTSMFAELYSKPERLEQFMDAMSGISAGNFQAFAEKFDFSRYRTLCDVGGATGQLSMLVAQQASAPALHVRRPAGGDARSPSGRSRPRDWRDRVSARPIDFFADPLPKADVITMGMILHDWNLEKKMHLIRAAYDALPPGGAFVVVENLIDDARRENAFGLMMSLNMLIEFGDAFDFTGADFIGWCREVGFTTFEVIPLAGPASAGSGL